MNSNDIKTLLTILQSIDKSLENISRALGGEPKSPSSRSITSIIDKK